MSLADCVRHVLAVREKRAWKRECAAWRRVNTAWYGPERAKAAEEAAERYRAGCKVWFTGPSGELTKPRLTWWQKIERWLGRPRP